MKLKSKVKLCQKIGIRERKSHYRKKIRQRIKKKKKKRKEKRFNFLFPCVPLVVMAEAATRGVL